MTDRPNDRSTSFCPHYSLFTQADTWTPFRLVDGRVHIGVWGWMAAESTLIKNTGNQLVAAGACRTK